LKLDKKYSGLLIAFFMTLALDTVMAFTMTSINIGWTELFLQRFLQAWIMGFAVAFPTSLVAIFFARKIVSSLISE
jgi:hypothetical protein